MKNKNLQDVKLLVSFFSQHQGATFSSHVDESRQPWELFHHPGKCRTTGRRLALLKGQKEACGERSRGGRAQ